MKILLIFKSESYYYLWTGMEEKKTQEARINFQNEWSIPSLC